MKENTAGMVIIPPGFELVSLKELDIVLPIFQTLVAVGFPSPVDDYLEDKLDLNKLIIRNPSSTFMLRVTGNSMEDAYLFPGDLLIVDRSLTPTHRRIIIGVIDGKCLVKRMELRNGKIFLIPENTDYEPTEITDAVDFQHWGVVTWSLHNRNIIR